MDKRKSLTTPRAVLGRAMVVLNAVGLDCPILQTREEFSPKWAVRVIVKAKKPNNFAVAKVYGISEHYSRFSI
eukprot:scaffold132_cov170-Amphora_coffeaeformis.AAC.14